MNRLILATLGLVFYSGVAELSAYDDTVGFPETLTNDEIRACVEVLDDGRISYDSTCFVTINEATYNKEFDAEGDFANLYLDSGLTLKGDFLKTEGDTATYTISAPSVSHTAQMNLTKAVAP